MATTSTCASAGSTSSQRPLPPVIKGVVRLLHDLCSRNSSLPRGNTAFHSTTIPPMTIADYMKRIFKYSNCSEEAVVVALALVIKHSAAVEMPVSFYNIHRVLITAIIVAAKARDDEYFSNVYYGRIGGIQARELNSLEIFFLSAIHWDPWVSEEEYHEIVRCCDPGAGDEEGGMNVAGGEREVADDDASLSAHFMDCVMPRIANAFFARNKEFEEVTLEEKSKLRDSFTPSHSGSSSLRSPTMVLSPPPLGGTQVYFGGGPSPTEAAEWPSERSQHHPQFSGAFSGGQQPQRAFSGAFVRDGRGGRTQQPQGFRAPNQQWGAEAAGGSSIIPPPDRATPTFSGPTSAAGSAMPSRNTFGLSSNESCTPPSTPTAATATFAAPHQHFRQPQAFGNQYVPTSPSYVAVAVSGDVNSGPASGANSATATPTRMTTRQRFKGTRPAMPRNSSSVNNFGTPGTPTQFVSVYEAQQHQQYQGGALHSAPAFFTGQPHHHGFYNGPSSPANQGPTQMFGAPSGRAASYSAGFGRGAGAAGYAGNGAASLASGQGYAHGGHSIGGAPKQKRQAEWGDSYGD